jgi:hypothetical protein
MNTANLFAGRLQFTTPSILVSAVRERSLLIVKLFLIVNFCKFDIHIQTTLDIQRSGSTSLDSSQHVPNNSYSCSLIGRDTTVAGTLVM